MVKRLTFIIRLSVFGLSLSFTQNFDLFQLALARKISSLPPTLGAQPVDQVRADLFKRGKSKEADTLAQALYHLQKKDLKKARNLTYKIPQNSMFSDMALSIRSDTYFKEAESFLKKKSWPDALTAAEKAHQTLIQIQTKNPYSSLQKSIPSKIGETELLQAHALYEQKKLKLAQSRYEHGFQRIGPLLTTVRPETLDRYLATCVKQSGTLCEAWISRFITLYAKGSEEWRILNTHFPEAAKRSQTPISFQRLTQSYKAPDLDQQAFEKAMAAYLNGDFSEAISKFQQFLDEFPKSAFRFRGRFWLAQSLSKKRETEKSQRVYEELIKEAPLTYYGFLASLATGKNIETQIDGNLPLVSNNDINLLPEETLYLRRAENFLLSGAFALASHDLKEIKTKSTFSNEFLMYLATLHFEAKNHAASFSILSELIQRGHTAVFTSHGLRLIFPELYFDEIQSISAAQKLDPILVLSLIKQESAFNREATSHVGASGLMQLMPFTATEVEPTVARAELFDATINIRIGTKYLRKMIDKFNGNIALALSAYNAGPAHALRWEKEGKTNQGLLEYIETIPFKETREYISSIIRNYFWYSRKLNGETPKDLTFFWNIYGPTPDQPPLPEQTIPPETPERAPASETDLLPTPTPQDRPF